MRATVQELERRREATNTERLLLVGRIHRLDEQIRELQEDDKAEESRHRLVRGGPLPRPGPNAG